MRRIRLFTDLVSFPAAVLLFVITVLGNLNLIVALFPQAQGTIQSLLRITWIAQALGFLAQSMVPNWLGGFLIILVIALFQGAFRRLSLYYWPRPTIEFDAQVETRGTPNGDVTFATLVAHNQEEQEITDCRATLETATNLYGPQMTPAATIRNNRLRWAHDPTSGNDCKISVPKSTYRTIAVADTANGFQFASCKPSNTTNHGLLGIYLVRIRVDGKIKGKDIEAQVFDGYLYVESAGPGAFSIIFGKSDWRKDKRLAKLNRQNVFSRLFRRP